MRRDFKSKSGLTLIEMLIGIAIISIVMIAVYQGFAVFLDIFNSFNIRVLITDIANQELEIIRNVSYDQIGIQGGIPPGIIFPEKNEMKGGKNFLIQTTIRNIDDLFDGLA